MLQGDMENVSRLVEEEKHQLPDIAHSNTRENPLAIFLTAGQNEKKLFFRAKAISPSSHLCHLSHYFILWRRQGGHLGRMPTLKGLIPLINLDPLIWIERGTIFTEDLYFLFYTLFSSLIITSHVTNSK